VPSECHRFIVIHGSVRAPETQFNQVRCNIDATLKIATRSPPGKHAAHRSDAAGKQPLLLRLVPYHCYSRCANPDCVLTVSLLPILIVLALSFRSFFLHAAVWRANTILPTREINSIMFTRFRLKRDVHADITDLGKAIFMISYTLQMAVIFACTIHFLCAF